MNCLQRFFFSYFSLISARSSPAVGDLTRSLTLIQLLMWILFVPSCTTRIFSGSNTTASAAMWRSFPNSAFACPQPPPRTVVESGLRTLPPSDSPWLPFSSGSDISSNAHVSFSSNTSGVLGSSQLTPNGTPSRCCLKRLQLGSPQRPQEISNPGRPESLSLIHHFLVFSTPKEPCDNICHFVHHTWVERRAGDPARGQLQQQGQGHVLALRCSLH